MKRTRFLFAILALFVSVAAWTPSSRAQAQQATSSAAAADAPADVDRIIRAFTAKEAEFRQALNNYGYKRDVVIQTLGLGGQISGEYRRVSRFVSDDTGNRFEKITFFPMPTLTEISVTPEDLEDLGGIQPYALETAKAAQYKFTYVGKERLDEVDTYIFDVAPKVIPDFKKTKERFFLGRIWVDQQELQIVRARGKGVPDDKNNKFAIFETYREQIDGRYWFPTYIYSDDELVFGSGQTVRFRARIRYTEYEKLKGRVRIIEDTEPGVDAPNAPPSKPAATPTPVLKRP